MIRSCKIRIYPTAEQESVLRQRMGAMRYVWNWMLTEWQEDYQAGGKPSAYGLAKLFRQNKPEWFNADSAMIDRVADNLAKAMQNFFQKRSKYPKLKKKGICDRYSVKAKTTKLSDASIKVPKLSPIKMSRPVFYTGKQVGNVVFSIVAGRWYVSILIEIDQIPVASESQAVVGIDLGISSFAILSNGEEVPNPKFLQKATRRLAIRQRRFSRKKKGSSNRTKQGFRVARIHASVANKRKSFIHGFTSDVAARFGAVAIEDLNVAGMVKNHKLARALSDVSFGEIRRQLEYKMPGRVLIVDRWFPSSKLCSHCGYKMDSMPLHIREWTCPCCSEVHDRDVNAAKNLVGAACSEFTPVRHEVSQ